MINKKYKLIVALLVLITSISGVFAFQATQPFPTTYYGSDLSKYIPGFSPEMCQGGSDFLVQVDPVQGCSPRVVRSDLLEENTVPLFCPLQAIKINPMLDVPEIKSITLGKQYSNTSAGLMLTFYPARAALKSNTELVGSPTISNIGYLVAILPKQPNEKNMPDWISANVTAHIEYDALKTYGIGYKEIVSNVMSDETEWQSSYKQYGFWNGKGYVRVSNIDEETAQIDIYSDAKNKVASYMMKKGEVKRGYLPGFYCSAGYDIKLDETRLPTTKAKLVIDFDEASVSQGSKILDGKCSVSEIKEGDFGGGTVKLSCPDGVKYVTINLPTALLAYKDSTTSGQPKEEEYSEYKVGSKILSGDKGNVYLTYVGESADEKDFVVVVKRSGIKEISNTELNAITTIIEKVIGKQVSIGSSLNDALKKLVFGKSEREGLEATVQAFANSKEKTAEGIKKELEKQDNFISRVLKDPKSEIKVIIAGSSIEIASYKIFFKGIKGLEETNSEENTALKEYYEKAVKEYEEVADSFPAEKNGLGDFYGAISLEKAAKLARDLGNKKESAELLQKLIDKYPNTPQAENAQKQIDLTIGYDMSKAVTEVKIKGQSHYIRLEKIETASANDLGTELVVDDNTAFYGVGDIIPNKWEDKITLSSVDKEEITLRYEYTQTTNEISSKDYKMKLGATNMVGKTKIAVNKINMNREAHVTVSPVIRGGSMDTNFTFKIAIEKRALKLSPEKTKQLINDLNASIAQWEKTVTDLGNLVQTWKTACFAGAAALQIKAFFNNLNGGSIARTDVMKEYKNICAPDVGFDKRFKSFSECYGHYNDDITKDIERIKTQTKEANTLMQGCRGQVGEKTDSDALFKACVESPSFNGMELSPKKRVDFQFDKDQIDDLKYKYSGDENKKFLIEGEKDSISSKEFLDRIEKNPDSYTDKKIEVYEELDQTIKSSDFKNLNKKGTVTYNDLKDIARDKLLLEDCENGLLSEAYCKQFENSAYNKYYVINEEIKKEADRSAKLGGVSFKNPLLSQLLDGASPEDIGATIKLQNKVVADLPSNIKVIDENSKDITKEFSKFVVLGSVGGAVLSTVQYIGADARVVSTYVLTEETSNQWKVRKLTDDEKIRYGLVESKDGKILTDSTGKQIEKSIMIKSPVKLGTCNGKFLDTELKVKYFETEPYKSLPAIVPFDKRGWYAAIPPYRVIGTQSSSAYDQSALLKNFWVCNAGQNGRIEFYTSPSGDDTSCCTKIVDGTPAGGWKIDGLSEEDSRTMVKKAMEAVDAAANNYGQKTTEIGGMTLTSAIQPISPEAECEDFMDPKDCTLLFNLCDPVLCPTSRCNLGGRMYVDDVVQSGIIGSVVLCLNNFGMPSDGKVLVPVCLTGIHAGLDNLVTILKAGRDCLQESLNSGKTVGICDEIQSIYLCEFFWREFTPWLKAGVPAIISSMTGKNKGGGGEYLTFNDAWDKSTKSVQYFTNSYGLNAFKAFRARTTAEVGSDICQAFISQKYPSSTFLDQLTEPESPTQFYARFDEIPMTTATIPARSQYKVYYHIYAGKDEGVNYYIYLKRKPTTSLYQQIDQVFIKSGFIPRGEFIDETPDIIAPSGMQELCVKINAKEECGFGKVTTSFAVNELTNIYLAEQAANEVKNEEECTSGTPSVNPLALNPNLQEGLTESLQPNLMQQGITRICAGSNPSTNTEPSRWTPVGYCDDAKKIRCWLDTTSVKQTITDKGLAQEVLDKAKQDLKENVDALGLMGDQESSTDLKKLEDEAKTALSKIEGIVSDSSLTDAKKIDAINTLISPIVAGFEKIVEKSYDNKYKSRAKYGLASLYDEIGVKINDALKTKEEAEKKEAVLKEVNLDENPTAMVTVSKGEGTVIIISGQRHTLTTISATVFDPDTKRPSKIKEKILIDGKDKIGESGGNVELTAVTYDPEAPMEGSGAYVILDKNGLSNFFITLTDIKLEDNKIDTTLTFNIAMTAASSIKEYGCGYANGKNLDDCHKIGDQIKKECFFIKTGWGWFKSNECRECSGASCKDFSYDEGKCVDKEGKCHNNLKCQWSDSLVEGKQCFDGPKESSSESKIKSKKIIIDPGHGGKEEFLGACGPSGSCEKDLMLSIAKKLKSKLEGEGFEVLLTRDSDSPNLLLTSRVKEANDEKADLFISLHANSMTLCNPLLGAEGTETYIFCECSAGALSNGKADTCKVEDCYRKNEFADASESLAYSIQQKITNAIGTKDKGIKGADFTVLQYSEMPAVLVETAYICNKNEEEILKSEEGQEKIAESILEAIKEVSQ